MQNPCHKIALILLLMPSTVLADTRADFLFHGPSVAAFGRGETGTAWFDDQSSSHYNPSLLASGSQTLQGSIHVSHYALFDGSMYNYLGMYRTMAKDIQIGLSVIDLRSGDVEIRQTITDTPITIQTNHWAYQLNAAKHFDKFYDLNVGLTVKYVSLDLYNSKGSGNGMDIGVSRETPGPRIFNNATDFSWGIAALNIVPPHLKLIAEEETLATVYRLGMAFTLPVVYRLSSVDSLSLFLDGVEQDDIVTYLGGIQYRYSGEYIFRSGYYKDHYTLGFGYSTKSIGFDYGIDFGTLTIINRFGMSYYWQNNIPGDAQPAPAEHRTDQLENKLLLQEARHSLRDARKQKTAQDKEVGPLFRDARKDYRSKRYLTAMEKFKQLLLQYPEYDMARFYYYKINSEMNQTAQNTDESDLEKVSYAKGYLFYRDQQLPDAINEWSKVLQIDPDRKELIEFDSRAREYLKNKEKIAQEKALAAKLARDFEEAKSEYDGHRWVAAIKQMEKVQLNCRENPFPASLEWYNKAQDYINLSLLELSRIVAKPVRHQSTSPVITQPYEIDAEGADRKYNEGLILYAQGKVSDALRIWEIATRLNPGHQKAQKALLKAREELEATGR